MVLEVIGLLTVIEVGANVLLWMPGSGEVFADVNTFVKDTYKEHVQPIIDRFKGRIPQNINIEKSKVDKQGNIILKFSDVQIIDFDEINANIQKSMQEEEDRENYTLEGLTKESTEEEIAAFLEKQKKEREKEREREREKNKETINYKKQSLYTVELKIPKDTAIGQIDFGDWEGSGYDVNVYRKGFVNTKIPVNSDEKAKVLLTLNKISLLLNRSFLLNPNQKIDEVITQNKIGSIEPLSGKQNKVDADVFSDGLADLIANLSITESNAVLNQYCKKIEQGINNGINILIKEVDSRKNEIKTRIASRDNFYKKIIKASIITGIIAGIAIAATVVACVFYPPLGVFMATAISGVVTGILTKPSFSLKLLGIIGIGLGTVKAGFEYQGKMLKIAEKRRELAEKQEKKLIEMKNGVEAKKKNIQSILNKMNELTLRSSSVKNEGVELKIVSDENSSYLDLGIVFAYFQKETWKEKNWSSLKLSLVNCKIKTAGIIKIAEFFKNPLSNSCKIQKIDLSGNAIGEDGIKYISEALELNTTLIDIHCDYDKKDIFWEKINNQLMVNRYLQGTVNKVGLPGEIKQLAIVKMVSLAFKYIEKTPADVVGFVSAYNKAVEIQDTKDANHDNINEVFLKKNKDILNFIDEEIIKPLKNTGFMGAENNRNAFCNLAPTARVMLLESYLYNKNLVAKSNLNEMATILNNLFELKEMAFRNRKPNQAKMIDIDEVIDYIVRDPKDKNDRLSPSLVKVKEKLKEKKLDVQKQETFGKFGEVEWMIREVEKLNKDFCAYDSKKYNDQKKTEIAAKLKGEIKRDLDKLKHIADDICHHGVNNEELVKFNELEVKIKEEINALK